MRSIKLQALVLLLFSLLVVVTAKPSEKVHAAQDQFQVAAVTPLLFGATAGGRGGPPSNFYGIDPLTGVATLIGPIGFTRVTAMDFDPLSGILYAIGDRSSDGRIVVLRIDPLTGAGTEVAPTFGAAIADISFRNSDSKLFGYLSFIQRPEIFTGALFSINQTNGALTQVGPNVSFGVGNGIAFSPSDTLYHANGGQLFTVNQTNGVETQIAPLHFPPGFTFPRISAMDFRPGTNILYGTIQSGSAGNTVAFLATINITTGEVNTIGQTATGMDALAWAPGAAVQFDLCLQDESNGNILQVNSITGEYQFTNCLGLTIGGTGMITKKGCLVTLQVNGPDRRVLARIDTCMMSGTASVQVLSPSRTFSILDRNTANNACSCAAG
ncbi:MAG: hypothetical protein WAV20_16260 [Blastocatellia bacterium]